MKLPQNASEIVKTNNCFKLFNSLEQRLNRIPFGVEKKMGKSYRNCGYLCAFL